MSHMETSSLGYSTKGNVLSEDQLKFYDKNGFLVIKNCVPLEILKKYRNRFLQICTKKIQVPGMVVMKDVAIAKSKFLHGEHAVTKIQDFHNDVELFSYCSLPQLIKVAQDLIGPNVMAVHAILVNKPPDPGTLTSRHPLHQDLHYFPFRPANRICCAWTAMERANRANGCLVVIPGTHKGKLLIHEYPKWEGGVNKMYHGIQKFQSTLPMFHLEMEAGDTVFFHPLLVHGSGANRTQGFRKAIACHYAASECFYIDVRGSSQDVIRDEVLELTKKQLGPDADISYEDIWRFRARLVSGVRSNL